MSEKKPSTKFLNQEMTKKTLNMIETLEKRRNTVKDKIKFIKKRIHGKKREPKQCILSPTRQKKIELNTTEVKS